MTSPMQWKAEALWQQLLPELPGLSVEVVERTSSTNTALLERARVVSRPGADNDEVLVHHSVESAAFGRRAADVQPCLLVAEHQTGGRGRHGRHWQSAAGASLTFSLSLPLAAADWSGLSLVVGLALADALDPLPPGQAPRIGLKWPNDLWLLDETGGRKLGGILIETVAAASRRLAVIGVGLNVRPMPTTIDASSGFACMEELDPSADPPGVLARVALPLAKALRGFERHGFAGFAADYARRDLLLDRPVRTTLPEVPEGIARGVDVRGALRVEATDGRVVPVGSGEVSVRLDAGDTRS